MNTDDLRTSLADLRAAIEKLGPNDAAARERLTRLAEDLEKKLQGTDEEGHHETVLERLGESIDHLRLEHPKATELLNRILSSLGGAGI